MRRCRDDEGNGRAPEGMNMRAKRVVAVKASEEGWVIEKSRQGLSKPTKGNGGTGKSQRRRVIGGRHKEEPWNI